jgi:hypothetical protein
MRYYIEQAADRFYSASELNAAKARARRLSKSIDGVYLIAEEYDAAALDYIPAGSLAFFGGNQDAREGCFA